MPQLSGISTARIGNLRVSDDLKESPLGSLGGKRVQTGAPGAPRVAAQGQAVQGGGSPSIFSRLNYTFSSTAKRSELDFRDDLKAASGEVADLLGAISQVSGKNPETADVENLLSQLPGKTERLTDPVRGSMRWDENGADPSEQYKPGWRMNMFVRERTVVHVSNMTPQQRESVRVGLEALKSTTVAADPLVKEVEQALKEFTLRELRKVMDADLDSLFAQAASGTLSAAGTEKSLAKMVGCAKRILESAGYTNLPTAELTRLAHARVIDVIENRYELETAGHGNGAIVGQLGLVLAHAPLDMQKEWIAIGDAELRGEDATEHVYKYLTGMALSRLEQFSEGPLATAIRGNLNFTPSFAMNESKWATALTNVNASMEEFNKLVDWADSHAHLKPENTPKKELNEVRAFLTSSLSKEGSNLMSSLSNDLLKTLATTARLCGATTELATIAKEIANRKTIAGIPAATMQEIQSGAEAAIEGDLGELLAHLNRADSLLSSAARGNIQGMGSSAMAEFVFHPAILGLDNTNLCGLSEQLASPECEALIQELLVAGQDVLKDGLDPNSPGGMKGQKLLDRADDLRSMREAVNKVMEDRALDAETGVAGKSLQSAQALLLQEFGLSRPAPNQNYAISMTPAHGKVQDTWGESLSDLQKEIALSNEQPLKFDDSAPKQRSKNDYRPEIERGKIATGGSAAQQGVAQVFVKDLLRGAKSGQYTFVDAKGENQLLMPREGKPDELVDAAFANLMNLTNGNSQLVMFITQLCHQGIVGDLQGLNETEHNPVKTPDGHQIVPHGGGQYFHLASDGSGGVHLRVEAFTSDMKAGNQLGDVDTMWRMDPARSEYHVSATIHISKEGAVSTSSPVRTYQRLAQAQINVK